MNNTPELDSFDRALLTELRHVVAERATAPVRRSRRGFSLAGGGIAAAAIAAFGLSTLNPAAAYAVEKTDAGDIVITIHELDDAAGLEQTLATFGIDADVDYRADRFGAPADLPSISEIDPHALPEGFQESEGGSTLEGGATLSGGDPSVLENSPCGDFDKMPYTSELRSDDFVITIPADSVLREADSTLKITTTGDVADQVAGLDVAYTVDGAECGFGSVTAQAGPLG